MGKTLDRMRANPKADWRIEDVAKACREVGAQFIEPKSGSHYKVRDPHSGRKLPIPARKPIKPVYIVQLVRLLEEIGTS